MTTSGCGSDSVAGSQHSHGKPVDPASGTGGRVAPASDTGIGSTRIDLCDAGQYFLPIVCAARAKAACSGDRFTFMHTRQLRLHFRHLPEGCLLISAASRWAASAEQLSRLAELFTSMLRFCLGRMFTAGPGASTQRTGRSRLDEGDEASVRESGAAGRAARALLSTLLARTLGDLSPARLQHVLTEATSLDQSVFGLNRPVKDVTQSLAVLAEHLAALATVSLCVLVKDRSPIALHRTAGATHCFTPMDVSHLCRLGSRSRSAATCDSPACSHQLCMAGASSHSSLLTGAMGSQGGPPRSRSATTASTSGKGTGSWNLGDGNAAKNTSVKTVQAWLSSGGGTYSLHNVHALRLGSGYELLCVAASDYSTLIAQAHRLCECLMETIASPPLSLDAVKSRLDNMESLLQEFLQSFSQLSYDEALEAATGATVTGFQLCEQLRGRFYNLSDIMLAKGGGLTPPIEYRLKWLNGQARTVACNAARRAHDRAVRRRTADLLGAWRRLVSSGLHDKQIDALAGPSEWCALRLCAPPPDEADLDALDYQIVMGGPLSGHYEPPQPNLHVRNSGNWLMAQTSGVFHNCQLCIFGALSSSRLSDQAAAGAATARDQCVVVLVNKSEARAGLSAASMSTTGTLERTRKWLSLNTASLSRPSRPDTRQWQRYWDEQIRAADYDLVPLQDLVNALESVKCHAKALYRVRHCPLVQCALADVDRFVAAADPQCGDRVDRVLLFPPLDARRRYLLHRTVQEYYPHLGTFSAGQEPHRRLCVYFLEHIENKELVSLDAGAELGSSPPVKCTREEAPGMEAGEREPALNSSNEAPSSDGSNARRRKANRKPDRGIYTPPVRSSRKTKTGSPRKAVPDVFAGADTEPKPTSEVKNALETERTGSVAASQRPSNQGGNDVAVDDVSSRKPVAAARPPAQVSTSCSGGGQFRRKLPSDVIREMIEKRKIERAQEEEAAAAAAETAATPAAVVVDPGVQSNETPDDDCAFKAKAAIDSETGTLDQSTGSCILDDLPESVDDLEQREHRRQTPPTTTSTSAVQFAVGDSDSSHDAPAEPGPAEDTAAPYIISDQSLKRAFYSADERSSAEPDNGRASAPLPKTAGSPPTTARSFTCATSPSDSGRASSGDAVLQRTASGITWAGWGASPGNGAGESAPAISSNNNDKGFGDELPDTWEDMCDDGGNVHPSVLNEINETLGRVRVHNATFDYEAEQRRCADTLPVRLDEGGLAHVLEAYDLPRGTTGAELKQLLVRASRQAAAVGHVEIKWVDARRALVAFPTKRDAMLCADQAGAGLHLRPLSEASEESRHKAKQFAEFLVAPASSQPRPQTNAFLARRLVEGHLGVRAPGVTDDRRRIERALIDTAKRQKREAARQRKQMWDDD